MRAALRAIRRRKPSRVVLAVPVAAPETLESLRSEADDVVCLAPDPDMYAIGLAYDDFTPTSDDDVVALLDRARAPAPSDTGRERSVEIKTPDARLQGDLAIPRGARGIVLFAHGSGSSRKSPRNRFVAEALRRAGFATLLFDLLTVEEETIDMVDARLRFDIELLARRLVAATDWIVAQPEARGLRVGYFGASTGAAAALEAAAERPDVVGAIVSRGGRPDLAGSDLARVVAPTLLIVGAYDDEVLRLNLAALQELEAPSELKIVPGATHLFEEPGALEEVATLAAEWLTRHLAPAQLEAHA
jgi:putative phosphoribosyl transferase